MNVVDMSDARRTARSGLSILSLKFQVFDDRPDWPVVQVLVDGEDPFAEAAPGWRGFDPEKILGTHSPLLPVDPGRRVAVYRCSCGEAGCGVIAPVIVPAPDRRRVSWVDFRDYVGIFDGPVEESVHEYEGKPWDLPDPHFDREQYIAEVRRACADDSWETPRRRTARLLYARLDPKRLVLPPDLRLAWASTAWSEEGITLMFQHVSPAPRLDVRQQMLRLTSAHDDPDDAARDMADQLLATSPHDWVRTFGWQA
ncbi:hypothetical protein GCM10023317_47120 [Actinopolymorpha pittospori]